MSGTGSERYGTDIIATLSKELTQKYGKGFDKSSLYRYVKFYQSFPEIVATTSPLSDKEQTDEIVATVSPQSFELGHVVMQLLSRMKKPVTRQMALKHLEIVLQVDDV